MHTINKGGAVAERRGESLGSGTSSIIGVDCALTCVERLADNATPASQTRDARGLDMCELYSVYTPSFLSYLSFSQSRSRTP